jgi:hypothetical protein
VRVSKHRHLGFRHLGLQDLGVPDLGVPDLGVPDLGTWDHGDRHITLLHLSIGNPILQIEIHLLPPGFDVLKVNVGLFPTYNCHF